MRDNQCVCCNALQKFYSALKNLNNFSINNDIIDNISALDCFFSEFRNITFVLQKDFKDNNLSEEYEKLNLKYLKNDNMKWFINKRNSTIKQAPISLEKSIIIEIYLPYNRIRVESEKLKINFEETFNLTKDFIKNIIIDKLGMVDVFFSTKIIFKEDGEGQEIIPKIIYGIDIMIKFLNEICTVREECNNCNNLLNKIQNLYQRIILNDMLLVHDYYLEDGKINSIDNDLQFFAKNSDNTLKKLKEYRVPINENIFGNNYDINDIFEKFIIMHIIIFNESHRNIYPAFMIVYKDFTTNIIPIYAIAKTTLYRNIYELSDKVEFEDVKAVFYCGEIYEYDIESFNVIGNLEYKDRIKKAKYASLMFAHINDNGQVKEYRFNEENIMCKDYIISKLKEDNQFADSNSLFFLNPIVEKIKKENFDKKI